MSLYTHNLPVTSPLGSNRQQLSISARVKARVLSEKEKMRRGLEGGAHCKTHVQPRAYTQNIQSMFHKKPDEPVKQWAKGVNSLLTKEGTRRRLTAPRCSLSPGQARRSWKKTLHWQRRGRHPLLSTGRHSSTHDDTTQLNATLSWT